MKHRDFVVIGKIVREIKIAAVKRNFPALLFQLQVILDNESDDGKL